MVFKNLCILVLWSKVALALEGLTCVSNPLFTKTTTYKPPQQKAVRQTLCLYHIIAGDTNMTHVETDQFGSKQLAPLRTNPLYTDYTLLAEGVEFPVHRAILVCVSDYFRDLFERGGDRAELEGMTAEGE